MNSRPKLGTPTEKRRRTYLSLFKDYILIDESNIYISDMYLTLTSITLLTLGTGLQTTATLALI